MGSVSMCWCGAVLDGAACPVESKHTSWTRRGFLALLTGAAAALGFGRAEARPAVLEQADPHRLTARGTGVVALELDRPGCWLVTAVTPLGASGDFYLRTYGQPWFGNQRVAGPTVDILRSRCWVGEARVRIEAGDPASLDSSVWLCAEWLRAASAS